MDHNEAEVSRDMYNFLQVTCAPNRPALGSPQIFLTGLSMRMQAFYQAHPKLLSNPFFLFGESYGGHYVPATALAIHRGNVAKKVSADPSTSRFERN
jgi:hypothetical protein